MRRFTRRLWCVTGAAALAASLLVPATPAGAEYGGGKSEVARAYGAQVAGGADHTCAILEDGSVRCWGRNNLGQLGLGTTAPPNDLWGNDETLATLPEVDLGAGRTAVQLASSWYFTCALLDDGTVRCWGQNNVGQLGLGSVAAPLNNVGDDETPGSVPVVDLGAGRTATSISAGVGHACAVLDTGEVRCWGDNSFAQAGLGTVAAPLSYVGDDETPGSVAPVDLGVGRTAKAVSTGWFHTCAILDDDTTRCWGTNLWGLLGLGTAAAPLNVVGDDETPGSVAAVDLGAGRYAVGLSSGWFMTCALLDNGQVRCWGFNNLGQLGAGNTNTIGDNETPGSVPVVGLGFGQTAVEIASGQNTTCVTLLYGNMRCWGANNLGQVGIGNTNNIGDNEAVSSVAVVNLGAGRLSNGFDLGANHTCVALDDGSMRCWGANAYGQLGYGNTTQIGDTETPDTAGPVDFGGLMVIPALAPSIGGVAMCESDGEGVDYDLAPTLTPGQTYEYQADWETADGSAVDGSDYVASSGTEWWNDGETAEVAEVYGAGDYLIEPDETFDATLSSSGTPVANGTVTILDDDGKACDSMWPETLSGGDPFDLEGDGDAELLIPVGGEDIYNKADAGVFQIMWGKTAGPDAFVNMVIHQNSKGVPDAAEKGDAFGVTTAGGDFNGDGKGDLAVSAPYEDLGGAEDAGGVHVFYGSATGLKLKGSQFWTQNSAGVPDAAESNDRFGGALAAGDFNGDGKDDLAIGSTESFGAAIKAGSVTVLRGSATGLVGVGSRAFNQNTSGVPDVAEAGDAFGTSLATGDLNGDKKDDLVVGAFREDVGAVVDSGMVTVFLGGKYGVTGAGVVALTQDSPGIADNAEAGDRFGESLAVGDMNKDGKGDLAIGAPGEQVGAADEAGAVHVLRGRSTGASASGALFLTQNFFMPDTSEAGDRFGVDVALGDTNKDGRAELAVGAPGEQLGAKDEAGAVYVLYNFSTSSGIALVSQVWTQDAPGVAGASGAWDQFGSRVELLDLTGDKMAELVLAVPGEEVGALPDSGAIHVMKGTVGGLSATGSKMWTQESPGLGEVADPGDRFGSD